MRMVAISPVHCSRLRGNRHNRSPQYGVRRKRPVKADQMQAWAQWRERSSQAFSADDQKPYDYKLTVYDRI